MSFIDVGSNANGRFWNRCLRTWLSSHGDETLIVDGWYAARDVSRRHCAGTTDVRDAPATNRATSTTIARELRARGVKRQEGGTRRNGGSFERAAWRQAREIRWSAVSTV